MCKFLQETVSCAFQFSLKEGLESTILKMSNENRKICTYDFVSPDEDWFIFPNPFVPNTPFLYPLKTTEILIVF